MNLTIEDLSSQPHRRPMHEEPGKITKIQSIAKPCQAWECVNGDTLWSRDTRILEDENQQHPARRAFEGVRRVALSARPRYIHDRPDVMWKSSTTQLVQEFIVIPQSCCIRLSNNRHKDIATTVRSGLRSWLSLPRVQNWTWPPSSLSFAMLPRLHHCPSRAMRE